MSFNVLSFVQRNVPSLDAKTKLEQSVLDSISQLRNWTTSSAIETFRLVSQLFIDARRSRPPPQLLSASEVEQQQQPTTSVTVPGSLVAVWTTHRSAILSQPLLSFSLLCILAPDQCFAVGDDEDETKAVERLDFRRLLRLVIDAVSSAHSSSSSSSCAMRFFGGSATALKLFAHDLLFSAAAVQQQEAHTKSSSSSSPLFGALMSLWQDFAQRQLAAKKKNAEASGGSAPLLFEARRTTVVENNSSNTTTSNVFIDGREPRILLASSVSIRFVLEVSGHFTAPAPSSDHEPRFLLALASSSSRASPRQVIVERLSALLATEPTERFVRIDGGNCLLLLMLLQSNGTVVTGDDDGAAAAHLQQQKHVALEQFATDAWLAQSCVQLQLIIKRGAQNQQQISLGSNVLDETFVFADIPFEGGGNEDSNDEDSAAFPSHYLPCPQSSTKLSSTLLFALTSPVGISLLLHRAFSSQRIGIQCPLSITAATWLARVLYALEEEGQQNDERTRRHHHNQQQLFCEQTAEAATNLVAELNGAKQQLSHPAEALQQWKLAKEKLMRNKHFANDDVACRTLVAFEEMLLIWCVVSGTLQSNISSSEEEETTTESDGDHETVLLNWIAAMRATTTTATASRSASRRRIVVVRDFLEMVSESGAAVVKLDAAADWLNSF